eukprot:CAMPEP_0202687656 /NCGR_PEP_ID=MMETSP1385-20130828/3318_1 /ASSEMBLY_ACC=CAM_ASM_000861 /TAXON_ID=933848 /ORGANISM="Elphidium margaritaceum" /LENGTH=282 /DNA_ID=CAMNT_0049342489 /DNA_START=131 /DNA_END=979 /DNA_ORIENTATION=+
MEEHDDFEFVDNDKAGFDDLADDDDEMHKLSTLNKELRDIEELKKQLKSQCQESSRLLRTLREQKDSNTSLQSQLKQDLAALNAERSSMQQQKQEIAQLLVAMQNVPSTVTTSKSLVQQLNTFYAETASMEAEVTKLKALRAEQEEMINQCKINIETLTLHQRECLICLDKSKSYACKECGTDIGLNDDIESKCYQVGQGQFTEKKRGYLFSNAVNMVLGTAKTENFTTGSYQISWTQCAKCQTQMGWKYVSADNPNNSAKVGKYCLARHSLTSPEDRSQSK